MIINLVGGAKGNKKRGLTKEGENLVVVKEIPINKLLIETDAPYLTPTPHRGEENHSKYLKYIANEIAQIKNISAEEVDKVTSENFKKLFL